MTVTKEDLYRDLRSLGLGHGDVVMFHSSYKAIGPVEGRPASVIEALRLAVCETGTVMAYVSWDNGPSLARCGKAVNFMNYGLH